jgi:hypothetical protein
MKIFVFMLFGFFFILIGVPTVFAEITYHPFEFHIQPATANQYSTNSTEVELVLQKYVDDMNFVLAKNTDRQLNFTATMDVDIIITQSQIFSTGCCLEGVLEDKIGATPMIAWVQDTNATYSNGGYTSFNQTGAGILNGMYWTQLYDPDTLTADTVEMRNYWTQINNMLHEIGHDWGFGLGEVYNLATVNDATGVEPIEDIRVNNDPHGNYWGHWDNATIRFDPMRITGYGQPISGSVTDYAGLLDIVEFGELTSAVINGTFRTVAYQADPNKIPLFPIYMNQTVVHVINATDGSDVVGADVKIWDQKTHSPYVSTYIYNGVTNSTGQYEFDLAYDGIPGSIESLSGNNKLKMVKVYKEGFTDGYDWISVFDAQKTRQIDGLQQHVLTISLETEPPSSPVYNVDLLDVYESESTVLGSGIPICEDVDLTISDTCDGTLITGHTYRFEIEVDETFGNSGTPTILDIDSSVGTFDLVGNISEGQIITSGCSTNTIWDKIIDGLGIRGSSGAGCEINSSTQEWWAIVRLNSDAGGAIDINNPTVTFTIEDDNGVSDISTLTTLRVSSEG